MKENNENAVNVQDNQIKPEGVDSNSFLQDYIQKLKDIMILSDENSQEELKKILAQAERHAKREPAKDDMPLNDIFEFIENHIRTTLFHDNYRANIQAATVMYEALEKLPENTKFKKLEEIEHTDDNSQLSSQNKKIIKAIFYRVFLEDSELQRDDLLGRLSQFIEDEKFNHKMEFSDFDYENPNKVSFVKTKEIESLMNSAHSALYKIINLFEFKDADREAFVSSILNDPGKRGEYAERILKNYIEQTQAYIDQDSSKTIEQSAEALVNKYIQEVNAFIRDTTNSNNEIKFARNDVSKTFEQARFHDFVHSVFEKRTANVYPNVFIKNASEYINNSTDHEKATDEVRQVIETQFGPHLDHELTSELISRIDQAVSKMDSPRDARDDNNHPQKD